METVSEETENKKIQSRKFSVWLVWLILCIILLGVCSVILIINKGENEPVINLVKQILGYFFSISMMYLGVNVGQKIGLSFADALKTKGE